MLNYSLFITSFDNFVCPWAVYMSHFSIFMSFQLYYILRLILDRSIFLDVILCSKAQSVKVIGLKPVFMSKLNVYISRGLTRKAKFVYHKL